MTIEDTSGVLAAAVRQTLGGLEQPGQPFGATSFFLSADFCIQKRECVRVEVPLPTVPEMPSDAVCFSGAIRLCGTR